MRFRLLVAHSPVHAPAGACHALSLRHVEHDARQRVARRLASIAAATCKALAIAPRATLLLAALLPPAVTAADSGLHPLGVPLADAELRFELQGLVRAGEEVVVESTYRPYRERDVRKRRTVHLFDSPWRSGSRETFSTQREESHTIAQTVRATDGLLNFAIPLRAPAAGYESYQLERIRVNRLIFERWFAATPALDAGFGLECSPPALQGTVRVNGIVAKPLAGALPLWPTLRLVQLRIAPVVQPAVRLWDPRTKHYWDGWRTSNPHHWPGGETIVARHINGSTVWRAHQYYAFAPGGTTMPARPAPPSGALPGTALEVFWPEGEKLEFPDVYFERPVDLLALRVAGLAPRAREILARSVELKPGTEPNSITADEWAELDAAAAAPAAAPVEFKLENSAAGKDLLVAHRRKLTEPWLYVFAAGYDADRRYVLNALLLDPTPWTGPLPE